MRGVITSKALKPMEQEYSITITLTLSDWKTFYDQVKKMDGCNSYPSWHILNGISDILFHAEKHFSTEIKSE